MSVSVGLLLPTRESVMTQEEPDVGGILALGEQAEALGLDALWVGDSVLARPRFEAITTLAAVAARTQRVTLGTAVLLPALRHPVVLANELASLDRIAGGRVVLGVGTASRTAVNEREFAACGVPFDRRIGVFEECVEVMRRLWTEPEVSVAGRHFAIEGARPGLRPVRPEGIPVWFSAGEDRSFRRVLRTGDGWITLAASPAAFAAGWARLRELAEEHERDPATLHRAVYVTLNIDDDVANAEAQVRTFVEGYYGERYEDHVRTHAFCPGTTEMCVDWLSRYVESGVDTLIVRFSRSDQAEQLERFARDVLPHLR